MSDGIEVPWPAGIPESTLTRDTDGTPLWIIFKDPKTGGRAAFPVTLDASYEKDGHAVWHIELVGHQATVRPSIHAIGEWHSPNPVVFLIVDELAG